MSNPVNRVPPRPLSPAAAYTPILAEATASVVSEPPLEVKGWGRDTLFEDFGLSELGLNINVKRPLLPDPRLATVIVNGRNVSVEFHSKVVEKYGVDVEALAAAIEKTTQGTGFQLGPDAFSRD